MAPELHQEGGRKSRKADVYAFGMMIVEVNHPLLYVPSVLLAFTSLPRISILPSIRVADLCTSTGLYRPPTVHRGWYPERRPSLGEGDSRGASNPSFNELNQSPRCGLGSGAKVLES
jgi:hypothetical protein